MAAPMTDLHIKHVLEMGLEAIRQNPDKHLADIFGDAKLDPHAALYGNKTIQQVKDWILKTDVPVILGFDLVDVRFPAITINLTASIPDASFIGDTGHPMGEELQWQDKEVVVPFFVPATAEFSDDNLSVKFTLPADMPFDQKQSVLPGLIMRDSDNREYSISQDNDGNLFLIQKSEHYPLSAINWTKFEVVSPVIEARFSRGAMVYTERVMIAVHGHSARNEGLWLYYIVMWTLLKFRPVLTGTFGLDLSTPTASDFSKDDSYLGEQVWRRFIEVQAKTVWSWETARQKDVLGLLLCVTNDRAQSSTNDPSNGK